MDFPKEPERQTNTTFRKTEYLRTTPGVHVIRLLPPIHTEYTHYVRGTTVACLGDGCPICLNNKKIIMENPENFRNVPGYSYARMTRYINVLDRTPAKVCTQCGNEVKADLNGNISPVCPSCNTMIADVQVKPLNKVKVFSRGKELFDQIQLINDTKRDDQNEKIGVENYDIELTVGSNKQPVPSARLDKMDTVEVPEEELFDLTKAVIRLEVNEVEDLLRGVSLRDIFAARKAETESQESDGIPEDVEEEVQNSVNNLFDGKPPF